VVDVVGEDLFGRGVTDEDARARQTTDSLRRSCGYDNLTLNAYALKVSGFKNLVNLDV
jgi:hypothetical protein